jgi:hypothetical protein
MARRARSVSREDPLARRVRPGGAHARYSMTQMLRNRCPLRLGPLTRWGRCPVGHHWATMHPVKDDELSDQGRITLYGEAPL